MKEISKKEYESAKGLVALYEKQELEKEKIRLAKLEEERQIKIKNCKEHYYLPAGKWSYKKICQFCGDEIG